MSRHTFKKRSRYFPLNCQLLNCPLGHIVVPRDAVFVEKHEKTFPIAIKSLLVRACYFGFINPIADGFFVKTLHGLFELVEIPLLQSMLFDSFKNWHNQVSYI